MNKIKWLTGGFIFFLILIVLVANLGLGPVYFPFIYKYPGLDKIGHLLLMGFLSFFVNTLFNGDKVTVLSLKLLKGSLVVFLLVALEEFSQILLANRAFSLLDLAFDLAGIIVFGRLADYRIRSNPSE